MKGPLLTAIVLLITVAACAAAQPPGDRKALKARVREAAFGEPLVTMAKSMPPQFRLALKREMPTPGWTFHVDAIEVDAEGRRIVARITETGPDGMVAQVLTPTGLQLDLGVLDPGRYFVELWTRRGDGKYAPADALVLEAE